MTKVGCAIPCYRGCEKTLSVVEQALDYVDMVVLIDDGCPYETGHMVKRRLESNKRLSVLFNKSNLGVGRSTVIGFSYLIEHGCDVVDHQVSQVRCRNIGIDEELYPETTQESDEGDGQ